MWALITALSPCSCKSHTVMLGFPKGPLKNVQSIGRALSFGSKAVNLGKGNIQNITKNNVANLAAMPPSTSKRLESIFARTRRQSCDECPHVKETGVDAVHEKLPSEVHQEFVNCNCNDEI